LQVASLAQQLHQSEDDKAKKVDEMSKILQMHTTHIINLHNQLGTSKPDSTARGTDHLTVGVGEGLFEIHVERLQLCPEALGSLADQVRYFGVAVDVKRTDYCKTWLIQNSVI
jgi:hypothetical protein